MKSHFKPGDRKAYIKKVNAEDTATFHGSVVHGVYSTFAIARDMEWSSRLFVLEMREEHEEGVGTFVHVDHHAPAFAGDAITITATVESLKGNELICSVEAAGPRGVVASGRTGQKILTREKLSTIMNREY